MEKHAVTEVDNVLVSDITSCVYDRACKDASPLPIFIVTNSLMSE